MKTRYACLDVLRGGALLSMILYHTVWDLVYIANFRWRWFESDAAYLWQQSICWTFIYLSGFCVPLGKRKFRRAFLVSLAGIVITVVTLCVSPQQRVVFGVLTFLGAGMFLVAVMEKLLQKISPEIGVLLSISLFVLTRNINRGYLGFESWNLLELPNAWYHKGLFMTFVGFPKSTFFSTDYFSLFPWYFLFLVGYFSYHLADKYDFLKRLQANVPRCLQPLMMLGKNSLFIYLLHQPIIYAVIVCVAC